MPFILQLTPLVNSRCTPPLTTVKSCSMCPLCCLILPTTPNRYLSIFDMKNKTGFITIIQRIHRKQNVDNLYRVVCCSFVSLIIHIVFIFECSLIYCTHVITVTTQATHREWYRNHSLSRAGCSAIHTQNCSIPVSACLHHCQGP